MVDGDFTPLAVANVVCSALQTPRQAPIQAFELVTLPSIWSIVFFKHIIFATYSMLFQDLLIFAAIGRHRLI